MTIVVYDLPGSFAPCFFFIISSPFSSRVFVSPLDGGGVAGWSFPVGVAAGPLGELVDGALTPAPDAAAPDLEAYAALRLNEPRPLLRLPGRRRLLHWC